MVISIPGTHILYFTVKKRGQKKIHAISLPGEERKEISLLVLKSNQPGFSPHEFNDFVAITRCKSKFVKIR